MTLTNSFPADPNIYWTTFVDSNLVQCASGGTSSISSGGDSGPPPAPSVANRVMPATQVAEPVAKRADGSGSAVPLCIFPPDSDLSGYLILDPSSGEWVSGNGYTVSRPSLNRPQPNDP